jgi:hypothetical protein
MQTAAGLASSIIFIPPALHAQVIPYDYAALYRSISPATGFLVHRGTHSSEFSETHDAGNLSKMDEETVLEHFFLPTPKSPLMRQIRSDFSCSPNFFFTKRPW